ncbi:PAS domain S-box protein [Neobacillus sp. NPDC058068]|uniref:PAS domain S-box protein n=1 Tax=Neobacillus sp. NPDC058068 TaxID=3346325 RepID=UPI0036DE1833
MTSNQDAIFAMDLEGYFVLVNPAYEKLTGYSAEEAVSLKLQSLIPVENLDKVFHHFHKAVLGQFHNFDCRMTNKIGQTLDINLTNIPISVDDQIVGVYGVAKDITQLKRKKEEVRKMEEIHRSLTENVFDIIVSTNLQGELLYVSPACEHILGYTREELLNRNSLSLLHVDDRDRAYADIKGALINQENGSGSYRINKKDGSFIWVEILCKPIVDPDTRFIVEVVSVIRDISERKRAEEEAEKREETYRDLVENSPDAVIIARGCEMLFINETGRRLLGASNKEDILDKNLLDLIHPDLQETARKRTEFINNNEALMDFFEFKLIRLDGTFIEAEAKCMPTIYENKPAQHIIFRDITERKKTRQLLLNSEKLTIAGQLAAGVAHEVRNPLTAIKGFLQLMEAQVDNKTYFTIIQSEMERIEIILSELLLLAKPQDFKFVKENLKVLIDNVKTLIDTQAILNNIQVEIVNDCENLTIRCDKNQLKQVFINLLKNAIEAMNKGGIITIEIKEYGLDKVKIYIKDTGNGVPEQILNRIGEPFFTTKESGTGLGIMISKQIIENHNGKFHFWSDGNGTMIEVILPIS